MGYEKELLRGIAKKLITIDERLAKLEETLDYVSEAVDLLVKIKETEARKTGNRHTS